MQKQTLEEKFRILHDLKLNAIEECNYPFLETLRGKERLLRFQYPKEEVKEALEKLKIYISF